MNGSGQAGLGQAAPGPGWTTLGLGCNCAGWRAGAGAGCLAAQLGVENCFFLILLEKNSSGCQPGPAAGSPASRPQVFSSKKIHFLSPVTSRTIQNASQDLAENITQTSKLQLKRNLSTYLNSNFNAKIDHRSSSPAARIYKPCLEVVWMMFG